MPDSAPLWHPEVSEISLDKVLAALADPYRRRVVLDLAASNGTPLRCAGFPIPLAKATRTHHFRVLRESGLIHQVDHGNGRTNTLRRDDMDRRFPGLLAAIVAAGPGDASSETPDQMPASSSAGESTPAPVR